MSQLSRHSEAKSLCSTKARPAPKPFCGERLPTAMCMGWPITRVSAERHGLAHDRIILSAKVSGVQDLIDVYRALAAVCDYPLHLGLTEAGLGSKGIVAT